MAVNSLRDRFDRGSQTLKVDDRRYVALLAPFDWLPRIVESAAVGLEVKRTV